MPLVQERYHLVLPGVRTAHPGAALIKELQSDEWQTTLNQLPGYSSRAGSGRRFCALLPGGATGRRKRLEGGAGADQAFDVLDHCGSPYQETKTLYRITKLPFGLREEEMVWFWRSVSTTAGIPTPNQFHGLTCSPTSSC